MHHGRWHFRLKEHYSKDLNIGKWALLGESWVIQGSWTVHSRDWEGRGGGGGGEYRVKLAKMDKRRAWIRRCSLGWNKVVKWHSGNVNVLDGMDPKYCIARIGKIWLVTRLGREGLGKGESYVSSLKWWRKWKVIANLLALGSVMRMNPVILV